jgi:hypothetical protein
MLRYTTYVINDGSATYANAYFELNYINVYSSSTETANPAAGGAIPGSGTTTTSTSATSPNEPSSTLRPTETITNAVGIEPGPATATGAVGAARKRSGEGGVKLALLVTTGTAAGIAMRLWG